MLQVFDYFLPAIQPVMMINVSIMQCGKQERLSLAVIEVLTVIIYQVIGIDYTFVAAKDDVSPGYKWKMFS